MIVTVNFAADYVVGKFALPAIKHDSARGPGSGVIFLNIFDTDKNNDTKDFIEVFHFRTNGHGVRRATAPVNFSR